MKINNKLFNSFLKKCTLSGKIETCIIRSDGKNISIKSKLGNTTAVIGTLEMAGDKFVFPVKSSTRLIKILDTFGESVSIEHKGNVLKIFDDNKEAEITLAEESYIDNEITKDAPFVYENSPFALKTSIFKNAIRNAGIVGSNMYNLKVKDKIFTIQVGDKSFDKLSEKVSVNYVDCESNYADIFGDIIGVIGEDVLVSLKSDYPIKLEEKTKEYSMIYFLAQLEVTGDD